jgi:hypothetical protein
LRPWWLPCLGWRPSAQIAQPFDWTFTRHDLDRVLAKIAEHDRQLPLAA